MRVGYALNTWTIFSQLNYAIRRAVLRTVSSRENILSLLHAKQRVIDRTIGEEASSLKLKEVLNFTMSEVEDYGRYTE